jgi:hypothetical protein
MIEGILYASSGSSVVINGQVLEEGEVMSGITIVKISRDRVEFKKDKTHWTQRALATTPVETIALEKKHQALQMQRLVYGFS